MSRIDTDTPRECGLIWINQGYREYDRIAVDGDRALLAYTMPAGREFLVEISTAPNGKRRPISAKNPPARWRAAIAARNQEPRP